MVGQQCKVPQKAIEQEKYEGGWRKLVPTSKGDGKKGGLVASEEVAGVEGESVGAG